MIEPQTIASVRAMPTEGSVIIEGNVVAKNTRSFLLRDSTGMILVYLNAEPIQNIGDFVRVSGATSTYQGARQITSSPAPLIVTGSGTNPELTLGTPEEITSSAWDAFSMDAAEPIYVRGIAVVYQNESYINFHFRSLGESSDAVLPGALSYPTTEMNFLTPTNIGKHFYFSGIIIGTSVSGGFNVRHNVMVTEFSSAPIGVTSVTITAPEDATEVTIGTPLQLTATVLPEDASDLTVTWKSSNEDVATVSETGLVTGLTAGNVTITATSNMNENIEHTYELEIKEAPLVLSGIEITSEAISLDEGDTLQLNITYLPEGYIGQGVTWHSSNEVVATVSEVGLLTGVAAGTVTITATSVENDEITDTIDIEVIALPIVSIVINEIYGAGGNSGAMYTHDFVELYNPNNVEIDISGYTFYYASATGTTWSKNTLPANSKMPAKTYYVVLFASGATGIAVPNANYTFAPSNINMSGTTGKILLASISNLSLTASPIGVNGYVDFVGYGTATAYEGSEGPAAAPSTTTSTQRKTDGLDTTNNKTDFAARKPTPGTTNNI